MSVNDLAEEFSHIFYDLTTSCFVCAYNEKGTIQDCLGMPEATFVRCKGCQYKLAIKKFKKLKASLCENKKVDQ